MTYTLTNSSGDNTSEFHSLYEFAKDTMRRVDYRGFIIIAVEDHLVREFLKSYRESDSMIEMLYDHPVLCARDKDKLIPHLDKVNGLNYHNNNWVIEHRNSLNEEWVDYELPSTRHGVYRIPKFISSVEAQKVADHALKFVPHKRVIREVNYSV
ncbi:MAG: hypothetical protein ISN29_00905 [Gammaproteobacteria bacterium AqS3]|nr:hypothetical protein [Gammaproteobacteria bacterium AqS3]